MTGRLYRSDPTILAFDLINEPRCSAYEVGGARSGGLPAGRVRCRVAGVGGWLAGWVGEASEQHQQRAGRGAGRAWRREPPLCWPPRCPPWRRPLSAPTWSTRGCCTWRRWVGALLPLGALLLWGTVMGLQPGSRGRCTWRRWVGGRTVWPAWLRVLPAAAARSAACGAGPAPLPLDPAHGLAPGAALPPPLIDPRST